MELCGAGSMEAWKKSMWESMWEKHVKKHFFPVTEKVIT